MVDEVAALERRVAALETAVEPLVRTRRGFLADCRVDVFTDFGPSTVRIIHLPTGLRVEGEWDATVRELGLKLVHRGHISVNDARAALGLAPFEGIDGADALAAES